MKIIYGKHPVLEALQRPEQEIRRIYIKQEIQDDKIADILSAAAEKNVPIERSPALFFKQHAYGRNHQGIVAEVHEIEIPAYDSIHAFWEVEQPKSPYFLLLLDQITDVHNMGAILRTATFFNAKGAIVETKNCANLNHVAQKTSSGAIGKIPIIRVPNLASELDELKKHLFVITGAETHAEHHLEHGKLADASDSNHVLILGSESKGIRKTLLKRCDHLLAIPGTGAMESLNVSVAAGIFMWELNNLLSSS